MPDGAGDVGEACAGCDRSLGWVDAAMVCPNGCVYCLDCGGEVAACASCGEHLRHRVSRSRPLPNR